MRLIDEFASRVQIETGSFLVTIPETEKNIKCYHFIQSDVGEARYIYGRYGWDDEKVHSKLSESDYNNYRMAAIICGENVYIYDYFLFDGWNKGNMKLPSNVMFFNDFVREKNKYVNDVAFPNFLDSLETFEIDDKEQLEFCKREARTILLSKDVMFKNVNIDKMFDEQDIVDMLCGFFNMNDEISERLNGRMDEFSSKKSIHKKIKEFIDSKEVVEEWELAIANGLKSVDAKTVTVEFVFNDKKDIIKVDTDKILNKLIYNREFDNWDFTTKKSGEALFKTLGASSYYYDKEKHLKCEHISKITYGKKLLYVKK